MDCEPAVEAATVITDAARDAHNSAVGIGVGAAVLATRAYKASVLSSNSTANDLQSVIDGTLPYLDLPGDTRTDFWGDDTDSLSPDCVLAFKDAASELATEGWSDDPTPQPPQETRSPYADLTSSGGRSSQGSLAGLVVAVGGFVLLT